MIKDIFEIAKKDLLEFSRDKIRLLTFFIMPLFMMLMVGFIFPNQNILKNIPIGLVNKDNKDIGNTFEKIVSEFSLKENQQKAFTIKKYNSLEELKRGIKKQEINGGIFIPENFSRKIKNNQVVEILIIEDQANPQIGTMTAQVLTKIVDIFNNKISTEKINKINENLVKIEKTNISFPQMPYQKKPFSIEKISPQAVLNPIKAKIEGLFPGETNYFQFVAPGIIAMVVMTAVLTGLAASVAREKEQGTLDGVLIAPISRLSIIIGKTLAQSIRGLIQGFIILLLAIFLFKVTIQGNILLVFLILLLGIFSFVGLGILVSAIAAEQETATQLLFMLQFPMLFLAGVFFPIQQMPKVMQYVSKLIPLTYAINALRKVMVLGGGINVVFHELLILVFWGILTLSIAVPAFKKVITK